MHGKYSCLPGRRIMSGQPDSNYNRIVLFSCLATWITTAPFSILQLILSPFLRSNLFTIDNGTVVRNELLFEVAGWRTDSSCREYLAIVIPYLGTTRIYTYLENPVTSTNWMGDRGCRRGETCPSNGFISLWDRQDCLTKRHTSGPMSVVHKRPTFVMSTCGSHPRKRQEFHPFRVERWK